MVINGLTARNMLSESDLFILKRSLFWQCKISNAQDGNDQSKTSKFYFDIWLNDVHLFVFINSCKIKYKLKHVINIQNIKIIFIWYWWIHSNHRSSIDLCNNSLPNNHVEPRYLSLTWKQDVVVSLPRQTNFLPRINDIFRQVSFLCHRCPLLRLFLWVGSQWLRKNIVHSAGKRNPKKVHWAQRCNWSNVVKWY